MSENLNFGCQVTLEAGKTPRVAIEAYDGNLMTVGKHGDVLIDLSSMRAGDVEILADHDPSKRIGTGSAAVGESIVMVAGELDKRLPSTSGVIEANKSGEGYREASVGGSFDLAEAQQIEPGQTIQANGKSHRSTQPFKLIKNFSLSEVSLVGRGANVGGTQTYLAAKALGMTTETKIETTDQTEQLIAVLESPEAECLSSDDIAELKAEFADGNLDLESATRRVKLAAKFADLESRSTTPQPSRQSARPQTSNRDVLTAAILIKGGNQRVAEKAYGERTLHAADPLSKMSLSELSAQALRMDRKAVPSNKSELLTASMGTSSLSLPVALSDAMHKSVLDLLGDHPSTWQSFAAQRSAVDFHQNNELRPTLLGELEEIGADGEIKHATMDEGNFPWSIDTFAKMLTVSRKSWINDSAGFLQSIPQALSALFAKKTSSLFWQMIMNNSGSHFSAGNGNLLTTNVLDIDGLSAAIAAMREQTDANGDNVDIQPTTLVVPPSLESTARAILNSTEVRDPAASASAPTGNPMFNQLGLEVEPRLSNSKYDNTTANSWYVFAGPNDVPAIVGSGPAMGQLDFIDLMQNPNSLVLGWRCYYDRGVAFGEPKAAVLSTP